jgi:hypothetical protein
MLIELKTKSFHFKLMLAPVVVSGLIYALNGDPVATMQPLYNLIELVQTLLK